MKITIPNPCTEDTSKMTPNAHGSFCARCSKTVLDLTSKTKEEIIAILSEGKKVCAKLSRSQLAAPVQNRKRGKLRVFAYALMLVFGTTLFSCGDGSTKGEVVRGDTILIDPATSDTPAAGITDSVPAPKESAETTAQDDTKKKKSETVKEEQVEEQPKGPRHYPLPLEPRWTGGGKTELQQYIGSQVKYPEEAKKNNITGTVMVSFIVKTDGSAKDFKVFRGLGYGCDEEAIRIAKLLKWEPGKQDGKITDMEYNIAVPFGK